MKHTFRKIAGRLRRLYSQANDYFFRRKKEKVLALYSSPHARNLTLEALEKIFDEYRYFKQLRNERRAHLMELNFKYNARKLFSYFVLRDAELLAREPQKVAELLNKEVRDHLEVKLFLLTGATPKGEEAKLIKAACNQINSEYERFRAEYRDPVKAMYEMLKLYCGKIEK